MATAYCTVEEVSDVLPEFDSGVASELASMNRLILRASRRIDAYLGSAAELFPEVGEDPTARVFYGTGTPYLAVGAHVGTIVADDLEMPSSWTVPTFADAGAYLVTVDSTGVRYDELRTGYLTHPAVWPAGVPVTVTTDWGHPAASGGTSGVPGDITEACLLLVVASWRQRTAEADLGDVGRTFAMPPEARRLLDARTARRALLGVA